MQYYHHLNPSSVTLLGFHPGTSRSSQNNDKLLGLTTQGYAHIPYTDKLLGLTTQGYAHIPYICDLSGTTTQGLVIVPCPLHQSGLSHSLIPMSCFKTISQSIQPHGYLKHHVPVNSKISIYIKIYIYISLENHTVKARNGTEFPQHQTTVQAREGYKIPYLPWIQKSASLPRKSKTRGYSKGSANNKS